ncbi:hypothetical protein H6792_02140 [Candidatus Nomurabacteria bacterium]|nr:hypothetical protein [Candidatus Nomurabacteria bacterium]
MRLFFQGIKGVGQANLALIAKKMGHEVSGSDLSELFITDQMLEQAGVEIYPLDWLELSQIDSFVYSAAHQGLASPQGNKALELGIETIHQSELIHWLEQQFKISIAIAGTHGKTGTTSLLAYTLARLEPDLAYMIGSSASKMPSGHFGGKEYFVYEADEYGVMPPVDLRSKLDLISPDICLVTSIDFDHPDVFEGLDQVKQTFIRLADRIAEKNGLIIYCADDQNSVKTFTGSRVKTVDFGYQAKQVRIQSVKVSQSQTEVNIVFDLITRSNRRVNQARQFQLPIFGKKLIGNAAGVIGLLVWLDYPFDLVAEIIKSFPGIRRRQELIAVTRDDNYFFDDYGHHPLEIKTVIDSIKSRLPDRRLIIVFQAHSFSRTVAFAREFVEALTEADIVINLPIFASAREKAEDFKELDLVKLAQDQGYSQFFAAEKISQAADLVRQNISPGGIVLSLGAGESYKLFDYLETR